jgi:hypothetical protein
LLLPEEGRQEYVGFANALWTTLVPCGLLESSLAARIVVLIWRLQRAGRYEQYIVQAAKDGQLGPKEEGPGRPAKPRQLTDGQAVTELLIRTDTYRKLGCHEGNLERWLHQDLNLLWALQKARGEETARRAQLLSGQEHSGRAA